MKVEYLGILLILGIIRGGKGRKCYKQHGNGLTYIDCDENTGNCKWINNDNDFDDRAWPTVCYKENIANSCLSTSWILVECQQEPEETSQVNLCCCNEISCGLKKLQNREKRANPSPDPQQAGQLDKPYLEEKLGNLRVEIEEDAKKRSESLKSSLLKSVDKNHEELFIAMKNMTNATVAEHFEKLEISIKDIIFMTQISAIGIVVAGVSLIVNIILIIVLCMCMKKKKSKKDKADDAPAESKSSPSGSQGSSAGSSYMKAHEEKKDKKKGKKK